jgi:ABC-type amino acid transport substrate-binding protein
MLGPLLAFLKDLADIQAYMNNFTSICTAYPLVAMLIALPLVMYVGYIGITQLAQLIQWIRVHARQRVGKMKILLSLVISIVISYILVMYIKQEAAPRPILNATEVAAPRSILDATEVIVIGRPLVLEWSYTKADPTTLYQIQSARDQQLLTDPAYESNLVSGNLLPIARDINDTRYWRVRAVNADSQPISSWSNILKISQYKSSYERIKHTGEVKVYVSDSFNQGFFKFMLGGQMTGFDIELVQFIVERLLKNMGQSSDMKVHPKAVPWRDLLQKPAQGDADIIISTITRRPEREEKYSITFSEPYYTTTLSLLYKMGTPIDSIRNAIAGKSIGVMADTTSVNVVERFKKELQGDKAIRLKTFDQALRAIDTLQRAASDLDYIRVVPQ